MISARWHANSGGLNAQCVRMGASACSAEKNCQKTAIGSQLSHSNNRGVRQPEANFNLDAPPQPRPLRPAQQLHTTLQRRDAARAATLESVRTQRLLDPLLWRAAAVAMRSILHQASRAPHWEIRFKIKKAQCGKKKVLSLSPAKKIKRLETWTTKRRENGKF